MSKNRVQQTPEERLVKTIQELEQRLEALKTSQPPTIELTSDQTVGPTAVANGDLLKATFTITPPTSGRVLMVMPEHTVYLNSVSGANSYTTGGAWPSRNGFVIESWIDRESSDDANCKYVVIVKNNSGSSRTIAVKARGRVLLAGTTNAGA